jgi:hypothetical protein
MPDIYCSAQNFNTSYCDAQNSPLGLEQQGYGPSCRSSADELEFHSHGDNMPRNWMRLPHDAVMLGLEAQRVIGLRLIKLSSGGPAAQAEALRMVSEKTAALAEARLTLAGGGSAGSVIRRYRTHVRSNKRRLLKS